MLRRTLVQDPVLICGNIMTAQTSLFDWLAGLEFFGIKLGLSQTRMLFDELGAPDRQLKFIHLAGSNGKGSTGAMIESGLRGAGFTTGFYSSPHLVTVNERFRLNGEVADDETVLGIVYANEKIAKMKEGMEVVKTIIVKNKLVNLILKPAK